MPEAVIVDCIRTPFGKRNGKLKDWHPASLAGFVLSALADRNGLDPAVVDDVIMGCVVQVGEQAINIGRNAVLSAGWPESVPGTTVDRQCGSSQQAIHFAAQGVMAGAYEIVIAAGIEVMSRTPMGASLLDDLGSPYAPEHQDRYADTGLPPQGISAEMIAEQYGFTRGDLDAYAARSQQRAAAATHEGRFENEIIPVPLGSNGAGGMMDTDEGIRVGTTIETLAKLKPVFKDDGCITAGNSSQITDGASAVLITSSSSAAELGLTPRATFHSFAVAGDDPVMMLKGPIPATAKILKRSGLSIDDIDLFEVNEAFASVVLAWAKETGVDMEKVNVNGGAIALGHPLGASGGRLAATLLNELERTGGRYGMEVMCEGGGLANAMIIERVPRAKP